MNQPNAETMDKSTEAETRDKSTTKDESTEAETRDESGETRIETHGRIPTHPSCDGTNGRIICRKTHGRIVRRQTRGPAETETE